MKSSRKSYYAVIPASVRYHPDLCSSSKLLYGEITALCNEKGFCWATNKYFSDLYNCHKGTVSKWISSLEETAFIRTETIKAAENKTIRHIYLKSAPQKAKRGKNKTSKIDEQKAIEERERAEQVLTFWNSKDKLIKHKLTYVTRGHSGTNKYANIVSELLEEDCMDDIKGAIQNYYDILESPIHFWSYKYTLADFLFRGYDRFKDRSLAMENYLTDGKSPMGAGYEPKYTDGI